jgi:hypothetical protein
MAEFSNFDVEVQDETGAAPEPFNGTLGTAGTVSTITPVSGRNVQKALIVNPKAGVNANSINDVLYFSIDSGVTYMALSRGETATIPGLYATIKLKGSANSVKYELILWT